MAFLTFRGASIPMMEMSCPRKSLSGNCFPGKNWYILCHSISVLRRNRSWQKVIMFWQVRRLQKWGDLFSANIHASVSGTVKEIKKVRNNVGSMVDAIVVENDEKYETVEFQESRFAGDAVQGRNPGADQGRRRSGNGEAQVSRLM